MQYLVLVKSCPLNSSFVWRQFMDICMRRYRVSTRFHPVLYLALVSVDNTSLQIPLTRPMLALCGEGVSSTRGPQEKREHATPTPTTESLFLQLFKKHRSNGSPSPLWVYVFFPYLKGNLRFHCNLRFLLFSYSTPFTPTKRKTTHLTFSRFIIF